MVIHENSLNAYFEISDDGTKETRASLVYACILEHPGSTAREIKDILEFKDLNDVFPRITELKQQGLISRSGNKKCKKTGKTVSCFSIFNT